jgi:hypothetical protein
MFVSRFANLLIFQIKSFKSQIDDEIFPDITPHSDLSDE